MTRHVVSFFVFFVFFFEYLKGKGKRTSSSSSSQSKARARESDDEQKTRRRGRPKSSSLVFFLSRFFSSPKRVPIKAVRKKTHPTPKKNKTLNVCRVLGFYIRLYFRVSKRYTFKIERVECNPKSSFLVTRSFVRRTLYTHISAHEKKKRRRQEQQQEEERTTTTTRYGRIVGALAAPSGDDDEFDEKR